MPYGNAGASTAQMLQLLQALMTTLMSLSVGPVHRFFEAGTASGNPSMLRPGDVAVWKSNGRSHVGLVTGINPNGTFNTIEGNTSDAVRRRTHSFGGGLTGFVRPRG